MDTRRPAGLEFPGRMFAHAVVDAELISAMGRSASPNTLRALRSDLKVFDQWHDEDSGPPAPTSPQVIVRFLKAQANLGKSAATLSRYLASLSRIHKLLALADPTQDELVRQEMKAQRVELGTHQRQARGLRFKGDVEDPLASDEVGTLCVSHLLAACPPTIEGARDKALLSLAYDTGLRRAELVRILHEHIERLRGGAGRLFLPTSKTDREGEGAYAYLSPRTMKALRLWQAAAGIEGGPVFRRLHRSRTREGTDVWTPGAGPLTPQSVTLIYRAMARRAHAAGLLDELKGEEFEEWLARLSAHSTRVGVTQDLFAAGQDLAGIMQALRWRSPSQPARYAKALAVESGAAAKVVGKL